MFPSKMSQHMHQAEQHTYDTSEHRLTLKHHVDNLVQLYSSQYIYAKLAIHGFPGSWWRETMVAAKHHAPVDVG